MHKIKKKLTNSYKKALFAATVIAAATVSFSSVGADIYEDMSKPYNEYTWAGAHNAHASRENILPFYHNQFMNMYHQLADYQIRELMIDIKYTDGKLKLHHEGAPAGDFIDRMGSEVEYFLKNHPEAVIFIETEVDGTVEKEHVEAALNNLPDLKNLIFNAKHNRWANHTQWPTLQELVNANQRVIWVADNPDIETTDTHIMYRRNVTAENQYAEIGLHSCDGRHGNIAASQYNEPTININGHFEWSRLLTMNHFRRWGHLGYEAGNDNNWDDLYPRVNLCERKANIGTKPNFIAVDYVHKGDVQEIAEVITEGGVIFYEGEGATQNIVCGIGTGTYRNIQAGEHGCENDEAKSAMLVNVKAGARITVYDSPHGYLSDDYTQIDVLRDLDEYIIKKFEDNINDTDVRMTYSGGNGLGGKVSRFKVEGAEASTQIVSQVNKKCLDMNKSNFNVQMYDCHLVSNQRWYQTNDGRIKSAAESNRCLTAEGSYGNLSMKACDGGANQKWDITAKGELIDRFYQECVDLYAFNRNNHANVEMFPCNEKQNQKWEFNGAAW